ncbi:hypothetical protein M405DRAFT_827707 [Rhizopogon salebrosus TDB-379]|nr:hypothetical protein M405DRAFT_827707 [Rhizopogon salebrosus TDB-379]
MIVEIGGALVAEAERRIVTSSYKDLEEIAVELTYKTKSSVHHNQQWQWKLVGRRLRARYSGGIRKTHLESGAGTIEFPQSQARASEVIPTQVLQGTRKKRVR